MKKCPQRPGRLALAVNLALLSLACGRPAMAQTAVPANPPAAEAKKDEKTLGTVRVTADKPVETEAKSNVQVVTTKIGKGNQALRDIPQSITVVTEKLIDDRNLDTLKDTLHHTAGVTFLAAEGGEEDIRLRGFSMQQTGDIFVDGMRDPAIYERDTFNYDRVEVLRGSASMLFGRGSTGGVVNQVNKQAFLLDQKEVDLTYGTGNHIRAETDLNFVTGADAAFRLTTMKAKADNNGAGSSINKEGLAGNYRYGIGLRDEYQVSAYYLKNRNGMNYGLPWLTPSAGATSGHLIKKDPSAYYGLDSDYSNSDVMYGTLTHLHRFGGGDELKTSFRAGKYQRDQRASAVRFCTFSATNPECPTSLPNGTTISDSTILTRGTNNKIQDVTNEVLQSDYTGKFKWLGYTHSVSTGVDLNHENRDVYAATGTLTKTKTTLGDDDGTAGVDEGARIILPSNEFDATGAGAYVWDLMQLTERWKLLGGLRYDYFSGEYQTFSTAGATTAKRGRHDKLLSRRFGVLYQPSPEVSFHASYGTSFNTSGDTYAYDALNSNTDPEKSRNIEIGSKFEVAGGNLSVRTAIFHSTKYNERNTDTESTSPTSYVLSGERYAKGAELDIAGRITPAWEAYLSYAWIPVAKVKAGALSGSELVGSRPGLIPKHQASFWTTYQFIASLRGGFGVNGRTKMYPAQINTFQVEGYLTYDAMVEYTVSQSTTLKLNGINLTNKLYADNVYRGHYIPGKGRTFELTASYKF
jgi:catecholate siderophore receptor